MSEWTEICNKHKAADLQKEWKEKGYPVIEWKGLKKRVEKHHQFLVDIVEDKVLSPFRQVFAKQQKETRGNAALLLRKDHQLQYPGYYGPRGSGILYVLPSPMLLSHYLRRCLLTLFSMQATRTNYETRIICRRHRQKRWVDRERGGRSFHPNRAGAGAWRTSHHGRHGCERVQG